MNVINLPEREVETEVEEGPQTPRLMTGLLPNDPLHLVLEVERTGHGVRITGTCKAKSFRNMRSIVAVDKDRRRTPIYYEALHRTDGLIYYHAFIPDAILGRRLTFYADRRDGERTRIWVAGTIMRLPAGWYCTRHHLHLCFDPDAAPPTAVEDDWRHYIKRINLVDGHLTFTFTSFGFTQPQSMELVVYKFRDEARSFEIPVTVSPAKKAYRVNAALHQHFSGQTALHGEAIIDVRSCFQSPGLYSVMVKVDSGRLRGIFPYNSNFFKKPDLFSDTIDDRFSLVHSFQDRATKNIRLEYFSFQQEDAEEVSRLVDPSFRTRSDEKKRWLCGEYTTTARDNGWEIFNYLRHHRAERQPAYIIDRHNHDGLEPDGTHILEYGSVEHLRACRQARALLFTHHAVYVMPNLMRRASEEDATQPVTLFLQHGVLAIKPVLRDYHKRTCRYDLFNVSSRREQDLVVKECNFSPNDVIVSGLPRWDRLSQLVQKHRPADEAHRRKVLVFPTWRKRLDKLGFDDFRQSGFFEQWKAALEIMGRQGAAHDFEVVFCVHSIFERFASIFATKGIQQKTLREVVSSLPEYDLFVTDYSSLCFDLLYINRPSVFFMFDREEFFLADAPYINLDILPGPIVENLTGFERIVEDWGAGQMETMIRKIGDVRGKFTAFDDEQNCARLITHLEAKILSQSAAPGA